MVDLQFVPGFGTRKAYLTRTADFGFGTASFQIRENALEALGATPRLMYRHFRNAVGRAFGGHRREFLARNQKRFREMRVGNIGSRASAAGRASRTFFYRVEPQAQRLAPNAAIVPIREISGETFTTSRAAESMEFGGIIKPRTRRMLAIPIGDALNKDRRAKANRGTPAKYKASPGGQRAPLVALSLDGKSPKLYARHSGRARSQAQKRGATSRRPSAGSRSADILVPMYQLVRQVRKRPLLKFYETWDDLADYRSRVFSEALDGVMRSLRSGEQA